MKKALTHNGILLSLIVAFILAVCGGFAFGSDNRVNADETQEFSNPITPVYGRELNPSGNTYSQVTFFVPSATGLTKDSWDGSLAYNTDLIYVTYTKNGETFTQTIPEIKTALGDAAIKRTCYTYEDTTGGNYLILRMHMDNHSLLSPSEITAVTVKKGFQWCKGSTGGITGTVDNTGLNEDVTFHIADNMVLTPTAYNLSLLNLDKEYTDDNGANFSASNTLFIHWASGSQSGESWGALNLSCGDVNFGDLVAVHTQTDTYTLTQLQENDWITRVILYGDMFGINLEKSGFSKSQIVAVTLKAGLAPITGSSGWGNNSSDVGTADMTKALESDLVLWLGADNLFEISATALTVNTEPDKNVYVAGESFDPQGMTVSATLFDGTTKEITVTDSMCDYDFTVDGERAVTVSYGGASVEYTVNVTALALESISAVGSVTVRQFEEPDYSGVTVTAFYADESSLSIDMSKCTVTGVDTWVKGEQTATVTYQDKTATFSVTVTDPDTTTGMFIIIDSAYATENGGLVFNVKFEGIGDVPAKAIWNINGVEGSHVLDYIELDGVSLTTLKAEGKITRVNTYGAQIRINMDDTSYQPSNVKRVTIKAGLQWVAASADNWGSNDVTGYYNVAGAVVKEDLVLYNLNSQGWTIAAEKAEIATPAEKLVYVQGESLSVAGLTLKITLTDGTEKEYAVTADDVTGYDKDAIGQQTLTVNYQDVSATYQITVEEPAATLVSVEVDPDTVPNIQWFAVNPDLSGIVFNYTLSDGSVTQSGTAEYVEGLDTSVLGEQSVVFNCSYGGLNQEVTVKITVKDNERTKYITAGETELKMDSARNNFWYIEFTPSAAVSGTFKAYWKFENLGNNGNYVLINGRTLNEILADSEDNIVTRGAVYGKQVGFYFDNGTDGLVSIAFLKGFELFQLDKDYWGGSPSNENAVSMGAILKEDLYFVCIRVGDTIKLVREVESMLLSSQPKEDYNMGDVLDISNMTLNVIYRGTTGATEVSVTKDMCSYDFTDAGTQTVTITYNGATISYEVTVSPVAASALRVTSLPTKTSYDFGIDETFETDGMVVYVDYANVETNEVVSSVLVDAANLTIEGFDARKFGEQTITLRYGDLTAQFTITVDNISKNKYLGIDYTGAYASFESTQLNSLMVQIMLNGVYDDPKPLWGIDRMDYVADYILITYLKPDGTYETESVAALIEKGWITRVCAWSTQLVFHMDTINLLPCSWVDKRTDPDDPDDSAIHYVEGTSCVVYSVTFLPGFQWYTSSDGANHWGNNDNGPEYYKAIAGAVLKETITLVNYDGYGWVRPLKTDEDGNIASDALTITSLPTKTTYLVGETLNIQGLVLQAKYADGGEEEVTVGYSDITGYNKNLVGEQTLTIEYSGTTITFKVTVVDEIEEETVKKGGCSASMSGISISALALICTVAGLVMVFRKKESK